MGRKSLAKNLLGIRRSLHLYIAIRKQQIGSSSWRGGGCQSRSQRLHSGSVITFRSQSRAAVPGGRRLGECLQTRQTDKDRKSETCRAHYFGSVTRRISFARRPCAVSYTHLRAHETRHDLVCRLL